MPLPYGTAGRRSAGRPRATGFRSAGRPGPTARGRSAARLHGTIVWLLAGLGAGVAAAASGSERGGVPGRLVSITATDFRFDGPDTIRSGAVTLQLRNDGLMPHHAWLVRLEDGRTLRELERELIARGTLPSWAADAGGPGAVAPGGVSRVVLRLSRGPHVLLSGERVPDGSTAVMKGMYRQIEVIGPDDSGTMPGAQSTIELRRGGARVTGELRADRQLVRVVNREVSTRELRLYRLRGGEDVAALVAWLSTEVGPPPADVVGGVAGLGRGAGIVLDLALAPGEYVMVSRVPPLRGGSPPPVAHGVRVR